MSRTGNIGSLLPNPPIPGTVGEPEFSAQIAVSCKNPITLSNEILNDLAKFADNFCFYSCFLTSLIQASVLKYDDLRSMSNRLVQKGLTLMTTILTEIDDATLQVINGMWNALYGAMVDGWGELSEPWENMSFKDGLLSFVKSYLCRFYGPILLAVAQEIVKNLKQELYNRHIILGQLASTDLDELKQIIDQLLLYDWWLILKDAINRSSHFVKGANDDLSSAQAEVMYGASSTKLSTAESNLIAAWYNLAPTDTQELFDEYGVNPVGFEWRPYSGFSRDLAIEQITAALKALKIKLDEMRNKYNCLLRITTRIKLYRLSLFSIQSLVNASEPLSNPSTMVTFDIPAANSVISFVQARLDTIYKDMREVVDGNLKYTAPIKVEMWRNELWLHLLTIRALSSMPVNLSAHSLLGRFDDILHPLQFDTFTLTTQGVIDLNTACNGFAQYDIEHARLQAFLSSFLNILMNFSEAASNRTIWDHRVEVLKAELTKASTDDNSCYTELSKYDGYDCEEFRFLVELLSKNGLGNIYKDLMTGRVQQVMEIASLAESVSTVLSCLSAHIDSFENPLNAADAAFIQNTMDQQESDANVSARALLSVPSFQFNFLQSLISTMNDEIAKIEVIQSVGSGIC